MKSVVPILLLLAALGCRTANFRSAPASIVAVHGGVESWNGQAWVPARPNQPVAPGAKLRADASSYADLSAANSLTLISSRQAAPDSRHPSVKQQNPGKATRTVLVVERGCVLVSVADLAPDSIFQIQGSQVVAQVRQAEISKNSDGAVAAVSGQVGVMAGEKSFLARTDAALNAQSDQLARLEAPVPASPPENPFFCRTGPFSPFDHALLSARQKSY